MGDCGQITSPYMETKRPARNEKPDTGVQPINRDWSNNGRCAQRPCSLRTMGTSGIGSL